ncbi:MAG: glutamate--tRNA ligase [Pseudomonadota bacterium]
MNIKSRFCPSPTGYIHLGNARTALFSALAAHQAKGSFLLRIEDTDLARSEEKYTLALQADLQWLGCQWDEGPGCEKGHEPYYQAQRVGIYDRYYQQLLDQGLAYPCFCSEETLEASRRIQRKLGKAPRYEGECRHLSVDQIAEKKAQGIAYALRFHVKEDQVIEFDDIVRGHQKFSSQDLGDFIIKKSDGSASFMFCNAIDDALMGVNLALRGEDHLTNTPRQILILQVLDLTAPRYGHLSLIMGNDGTPLSKRNGSHSLQELRHSGFLPVAVVNYLARLGHVYTDHNHLMSFADCAKYFDVNRLVKAAARYDEQQLMHWQKEAVMQLSSSELEKWVGAISYVPQEKQADFLKIVQANSLFPTDVYAWAESMFSENPNFSDEEREVLIAAGKDFFEVANYLLDHVDTYAALCDGLKEKLSVKGKALFMPLRIALTKAQHGPELATVFDLLGKENMKKRFLHILKII